MKEIEDLIKATDVINTIDLKEAYEDVNDRIKTLWENSPSEDQKGREDCYRELHGGRAFVLQLIRNLKEKRNG